MEKETQFKIDPNIIEIKKDPETANRLARDISCCRGTGHVDDCGAHHVEKDIIVDERIVHFLLKEFQGHKIQITSGYRCPKHNEFSVSDDKSGMTKPDSLHTKAEAVDFMLLDKNNYPIKYEDYNNLIDAIHKQYQFSDTDWQHIYDKGDQDYLSPDNHNMMFAKAYKPDEGRDTDNKHDHAYMHLDFRGINPEDSAALPYYKKLKNN